MPFTPGVRITQNNEVVFTVWAPFAQEVKLVIDQPFSQTLSMQWQKRGYWQTMIPKNDVALYKFIVDNKGPLPDPASLSQPEGVHGPSEVINLNQFTWNDQGWPGKAPEEMIIYELHIGTFSQEGNFKGVISKLDYLLDLGINTIEIMPVGQFPGHRNWGYDGVFPYAAQNSYGGPFGLMELINACHQKGLAVILDVIYNHLGPEGNYLGQYGPYFTDNYKTPWGQAINFDDAHSDEVKNYFIQNALMWLRDFHVDALRLDAIHAIKDFGASPFLKDLAEEVNKLNRRKGRNHYLIGESNLNDVKVIRSPEHGGFGLDAQWHEEFHHVVHTLLTGEKTGYYQDFGDFNHLKQLIEQVFIYDGIYSPFHKKTYGNKATGFPGRQFVVCIQNHDQIGNRMLGERLAHLVPYESLKLGAGFMLLSPFIPMLFMGEEYGEDAPFLYFVDHGDPKLNKLVKEGRRKEFAEFHKKGKAPDPSAEKTFQESCLKWDYNNDDQKSILLAFYKYLMALRKSHPALKHLSRDRSKVWQIPGKGLLLMERWQDENHLICYFNFDNQSSRYIMPGTEEMTYSLILDSALEDWGGPGSDLPGKIKGGDTLTIKPLSVIIYERNW